MRRIALIAGFLVVSASIPAAVSAQELTPTQEYRSTVMQSIQRHQGALRAIVRGEVPYGEHAATHAAALHGLALSLSDIFPEGSGGEGTRAKPEIWSDWDTFNARVADIQQATAALMEAVDAGADLAALGEALEGVGPTCAGCHRPFRAPRN